MKAITDSTQPTNHPSSQKAASYHFLSNLPHQNAGSLCSAILKANGAMLTSTSQIMLKRGFNCNGEPPSKTSRSVETIEATQKCAMIGTSRQSASAEISRDDETDVLCILRPTSEEAWRTVTLVAETTPQHILQNEFKICTFQDSSVVKNRSQARAPSPHTGLMDHFQIGGASFEHPSDIALRLSSELKDRHRGFVFGRSQSRCDILMPSRAGQFISGVHFRVFVNEEGLTMLENISRNGTLVDGHFLEANSEDPNVKSTRMIVCGSLIEIFCDKQQTSIRFVVGVPNRQFLEAEWGQRLAEYVHYLKQSQRGETPLPPAAQNVVNLSRPLGRGTWPDAVQHDPDWNRENNYHLLRLIGKGSYGDVYKIAQMYNGTIYAMKQIAKPKFRQTESFEEEIKILEKEISLMQSIHHPNIVQFVSYEETPHYLYIFMEYCKFGNLSAYLGKFVEEAMVQGMARQILSAIIYLHRRHITHRDIKPDNILVSARTPFTFKLTDFGLSKQITGQNATLETWCGTPVYMAPEIFPGYHSYLSEAPPNASSQRSDRPYSQSVDLWSLGAVVYHLLYGELPVRGESCDEILDDIKWHPIGHGRSSKRLISDQASHFLSRTLALEEFRATDTDCAYHAWIFKQSDTDVAKPVLMPKVTASWSGEDSRLVSSKHHAFADALNPDETRLLKRSKHGDGNQMISVRNARRSPNLPFASRIEKASIGSSHLTRKEAKIAIQKPPEVSFDITKIFSQSLELGATGERQDKMDQKYIPMEAEQYSQHRENSASVAKLSSHCSPTINTAPVSLPIVNGSQSVSLDYDVPPPSSNLSFSSPASVYSPTKLPSFLPPTQPSSFVISPTNPPVQQFGQLITLPNSIYKLTIPLSNGKTSFGRDPSCTFVHPNPLDTRVPRLAFQIFWQKHQEEEEDPSSAPLIRTNSSLCIRVNGVLLKSGDQGKLCNGDVISVFENRRRLEKGAGLKDRECLQFRCDFFRKFVVDRKG